MTKEIFCLVVFMEVSWDNGQEGASKIFQWLRLFHSLSIGELKLYILLLVRACAINVSCKISFREIEKIEGRLIALYKLESRMTSLQKYGLVVFEKIKEWPHGKLTFKLQRPSCWRQCHIMRKRILVIYSGNIIIELLTAILSEEGYAADGSDGGEGLKMAYDRDYDIIISDVDTPIMNGIEFAAVSLRKHRCIKQKMLFITGDQNRETNRFIKNTGVRCLLKPFKAIELLKAEREIDASASIVRDKFIDI